MASKSPDLLNRANVAMTMAERCVRESSDLFTRLLKKLEGGPLHPGEVMEFIKTIPPAERSMTEVSEILDEIHTEMAKPESIKTMDIRKLEAISTRLSKLSRSIRQLTEQSRRLGDGFKKIEGSPKNGSGNSLR